MDTPAESLVRRCREGDQAAWAELVTRYSRYVHAIVRQGFRLAEHDAEDVFQEVFARAYARLGELRDDSAIQPWLAQMTRRLAIDRLRAQKREAPSEDVEPEGFDQALERLDEAMDLYAALGRVSESCREVLERFFLRDESYRTIATDLDIPSGTIASRISRCLTKMREQLEGRQAGVEAS